ncbi:hypothetical protein ACFL1H_07575, partial [Nanoarchaeota archaeon]
FTILEDDPLMMWHFKQVEEDIVEKEIKDEKKIEAIMKEAKVEGDKIYDNELPNQLNKYELEWKDDLIDRIDKRDWIIID